MDRDLDFALSMFNFGCFPLAKIQRDYFCFPRPIRSYDENGKELILIGWEKTNCFSVKKLEMAGTVVKQESSFYLGIVGKGNGQIRDQSGNTWALKQYDRFFVLFSAKEINYFATELWELYLFFPPETAT